MYIRRVLRKRSPSNRDGVREGARFLDCERITSMFYGGGARKNRGIYSKRLASKPSRCAGLLSNGEFRVKTWIQNILFLSSFYMAHKAVFGFEVIEFQRGQALGLARVNFDGDK